MIDDLKVAIKQCKTLDEIHELISKKIKDLQKDSIQLRIGYIAGKVTAEGPEKIKNNLARLHNFKEQLKIKENILVFSAADVFDDEVYWNLNLPTPDHEQKFYDFWKKILECGVTDIFMTPGWEESLGAQDEHKHAKNLKIKIHYIK